MITRSAFLSKKVIKIYIFYVIKSKKQIHKSKAYKAYYCREYCMTEA